MARTSSLGGFIKQLDREQATPQARTGVYCLINMMLGKIVLFPKVDSPKVGQRPMLSGQQTKNQCFQSLSVALGWGAPSAARFRVWARAHDRLQKLRELVETALMRSIRYQSVVRV